MTYEYEGRTEKEAIELASQELGLERDGFDIEIIESQAGSIFKKGRVKIRVHLQESPTVSRKPAPQIRVAEVPVVAGDTAGVQEPTGEFEEKILQFVSSMVNGMGYAATTSILFREEKKLGVRIDSEHASIIIGKKGKNLDSLQLLANVYAGRLGREDTRIILDSENYRIRREESLVRIAYESAEQVRRTSRSVLLEPMNPFERRIIHTTLNDIVDIETKSEGEGLYKQVRVMFRGRP